MWRVHYSIYSMSKALTYYRRLYRRLIRLPLDIGSLELIKNSARQKFRSTSDVSTYTVIDRESYDSISKIAHDILDKQQYREIPKLLDFIYKDCHRLEPWKLQFLATRYNKWKPIWPQVHLIEEFGSTQHIALYRKELKRMDPPELFSITKELNLYDPLDLKPPTPINHQLTPNGLTDLLQHMQKLHWFLDKNSKLLMEAKLLPLEVFYEPTRLGIPMSVATRERRLRTKITYMKSLCQEFRPIAKESLMHLILVATDEPGAQNVINPLFFRHMVRVHNKQESSPYERKYLQQKLLVPNDRNIRFHYRTYVVLQFYVEENGSYCVSPMQNLYD